MQISAALIQKFLSGTCTPGEHAQVLAALRENPELYDQYFSEAHWEAFQPDETTGVPSARMLQYLQAHTPAPRVRRLHTAWIAAASVAALLVAVFTFTGKRTARQTVAAIPPNTIDNTAPVLAQTTITNDGNTIQRYTLPDGSKVKLGAKSHLVFNKVFTVSRDIYLEGQATFDVAKDARKPFTVHAKDIATTALGTVFSVDDRNASVTLVHLFSGKVVVKKEGKVKGDMADVYLLPGEQLTLNKATLLASVAKPQTESPVARAATTAASGEPMHFSQQPLPEILAQVEAAYKVKIRYNKTALQNIDFTGSFDPGKTTVESFLETLCTLNDLSLGKTNSGTFSIQVR